MLLLPLFALLLLAMAMAMAMAMESGGKVDGIEHEDVEEEENVGRPFEKDESCAELAIEAVMDTAATTAIGVQQLEDGKVEMGEESHQQGQEAPNGDEEEQT